MFETPNNRGRISLFLPFGWRYLIQLLLCYPAVMLAAEPFSFLLSNSTLSGNHPSHIHFAGYGALVCVLVGPIVGWGIGRVAPSLMPSGRWVWLPFLILLPDIFRAQLHPEAIPWLNEYLFQTAGEGGLAVVLFTLPACSAVGYSAGMALAGIKAAFLKPSRLRSILPIAVLSALGIAVFCLTAPLLRQFEEAKVERWSKVRYVVERPGLWLSRDPTPLCAGEPGVLSISALTMVEALESRNCSGDQLLEPGTPPQPTSWSLERVRVLNGPHAGAEGWVLAYGLLETVRP